MNREPYAIESWCILINKPFIFHQISMKIQGTFDCPLAVTICRSLEKLPGGIEKVDIIALPSWERNGAEDKDWTLTETTAPHVTLW